MKSLTNYLNEKLLVTKNYMKREYKYHPNTAEELREIILDRYKKEGSGTKNNPIDFNDIDVKHLDTLCYPNGITPLGVFENTEFEYIDLLDWDVSNVKDMRVVFMGCKKLKKIELSYWDVSNVENMNSTFAVCNSLEEIDLSKWDVSKVKNMQDMFYECEKLTKLDISKWNVSNVEVMELMFSNCKKLKEIDISNWDISNAERINFMFYGCKKEIIPDWYHNYKK